MTLKIGDKAPDFKLKGIDGESQSLYLDQQGKRAICIVFTCNHCPYAKAYEDRLIYIAQQYNLQKVQFILINSNDSSSYPEDSFSEMKIRAKKKKYLFPYIRDETQDVAKKYGAEVTPDCFLLNKDFVLVYRGRIDDNWQYPERVKDKSLMNAISNILSGTPIPLEESEKKAMGCSIKWKW